MSLIATKEAYNYHDNNLDIAYSIISENAATWNDLPTHKKYSKKIRNNSKIVRNNDAYINIKRKILNKTYNPNKIFAEIEKHATNDNQILLYSLVAASSQYNNPQLFYSSLLKINCYLFGIKNISSELYILESIFILSNIEDKQSQELAARAIMKLPYSHDKSLLMYKLVSQKYSREYLVKLWNSDKQKYKPYKRYDLAGRMITMNKPPKRDDWEKRFKYFAILYSMSWNIRNWEDYKIPLLAYLCYLRGDIKNYEYYRKKSISQHQLRDMQAGYFSYVEYAAKIFCLTNDNETAILLLNTLPNGHKKNILLKRLIRYLTRTEKGYQITVKSNIL